MSTDEQYYEEEGAVAEGTAEDAVAVETTPFVFKHRDTTFFPPVRSCFGL